MPGFDSVARHYDRIFRFAGPEELLAALQPHPGERVLDVGGGTGRVSGTFDDVQVVVCDPAPLMLREAQSKGLHVCASVAETMPFRSGSFARIMLVDTFHHLGEQRAAARELLRVLRPGGRLVVEEPDIRQTVVKFAALLERLLRVRSRFFSLTDMVSIFEAIGADIVCTQQNAGTGFRIVIGRRVD